VLADEWAAARITAAGPVVEFDGWLATLPQDPSAI